jgi:hypothetical protein
VLLHLVHFGSLYHPAAFVLVRMHRTPASPPTLSRITSSTAIPQSCSPATISVKLNCAFFSRPAAFSPPYRATHGLVRSSDGLIVPVSREFRPSLPLSLECRRIIELPSFLNHFAAVQPFRCLRLRSHVSIKVQPAPPALHSNVVNSLAGSAC